MALCQSKHKVFFWLVLNNRMSTRNMLRRRMHLDDYHCVLCQQSSEETLMHLLFYCPFAKDCWGPGIFSLQNSSLRLRSFKIGTLQNVSFALDIFILICWATWTMRNDVIFRNKNPSVEDCRRVVTVESLLLLHTTKSRITPLLESWINSNL